MPKINSCFDVPFVKEYDNTTSCEITIATKSVFEASEPWTVFRLFNMGKLSAKYLIRRNKRNVYFLVRKKGDSDKQFLNRITHLPLQNQFIEQILKISDCGNVKVLYLQNNLLKSIENMENFPLLTHLYLQRNFIVKIENLRALVHLKKIYLGHNEIQVLEGMEDLKKIKEIHVEHQKLPKGGTLYFEPLTVLSLGETLHVLNISGNSLSSLRCLKNLTNLRILAAKDNRLRDIDDIADTVCEWLFLEDLSLAGNPVTRGRWYRDTLVFASKSLRTLDNVPVRENTRTFIEKLVEKKKIQYEKHKCGAEESGSKEKRKTLKFADENASRDSCLAFANSFPPNRAVYLHPPWKLRSNVSPNRQKPFLSRAYRKKEDTHGE